MSLAMKRLSLGLVQLLYKMILEVFSNLSDSESHNSLTAMFPFVDLSPEQTAGSPNASCHFSCFICFATCQQDK